MGTQMETYK